MVSTIDFDSISKSSNLLTSAKALELALSGKNYKR